MRMRYSPELGATICARIARGETIHAICASAGMPSPRTFYRWLGEHDDFLARYEHAQEAREAAGVSPVGKASTYTPETATAICEQIIAGQTLKQICAAEGMPSKSTLFHWLWHHPEFAQQYTRAKTVQAEVLADEIHEIIDDPLLAPFDKRVRMDGRKWLIARMKPQKFGDRTSPERSPEEMSDEEIRRELLAIVAKAKARMASAAPAPPDAEPAPGEDPSKHDAREKRSRTAI